MTKFIDKLHRAAVTSLIGLTIGTAFIFSCQVYEYISRPTSRRKLQTGDVKSNKLSEFLSEFSMAAGAKILRLFQSVRLPVSRCYRSVSDQRSWSILKVNHIAVATKDLEKSVKFYKDILGAKTSEPIPMAEHGVTTVFVELLNTKIELLLPLGNKSPIENFLEKNPSGGMHHVCLEVDNIQNAVQDLKSKNIRLLGTEPKIGAHGKPVIFLHPKDCGGILIELEEV